MSGLDEVQLDELEYRVAGLLEEYVLGNPVALTLTLAAARGVDCDTLGCGA